MGYLDELLLAVKQEADNGNSDYQKLINYQWKSFQSCIKGILILYTAVRLEEKLPNLFHITTDDIIKFAENGDLDTLLWALYPLTMYHLDHLKIQNIKEE